MTYQTAPSSISHGFPILGPDVLVFGVDDVESSSQYFKDYGLIPKGNGFFAALDGTGILIRDRSDPDLPMGFPGTSNRLRKTIYGVDCQETVDRIAHELKNDRRVRHFADGSIESVDDAGYGIGFQVSIRNGIRIPAERINAPGDWGREINKPASSTNFNEPAPVPRTLSHVVYFVPDVEKAEAFYVKRLGFRVSDRFVGMGPFLRPAGTYDHHTLFLIQSRNEHMVGCDHFTFHMGGPNELMQAGYAFAKKGYESFWGPGRHRFGSNWFWYFNTPVGCHVEYDADMDLHDDNWEPRVGSPMIDNSQIFLFKWHPVWAPGGGPPPAD